MARQKKLSDVERARLASKDIENGMELTDAYIKYDYDDINKMMFAVLCVRAFDTAGGD